MIRQGMLAALCIAALWPLNLLAADSQLIADPAARRHGLTRPWFNQVEMDVGRGRVRDVVLDDGVLFVQNDRAMVQAIHGESGQTLWARQIGRPNHPSMTPGVNRDLLVIINGSRLYAVNRANGETLYETQVQGAPGAGAGMSSKRAFVPMVNGLVLAYRLDPLTDPLKELGRVERTATAEEKAAAEEVRRENVRLKQEYIPPLASQSFGRALVQPLVTMETKLDEYCVWPTDRGFLNIGIISKLGDERFGVKFRMESKGGFDCRPTYMPPDPKIAGDSGVIIAGGRDGFVYAVVERSGDTLWRFPAGDSIIRSPVLLDDRLFVTTQLGGMYCLDAKTGKDKWWAAQVMQFIAASKERIYTADRQGHLLVLNAQTGQRLDALDVGDLSLAVPNSENDRLYLVSKTGLVQCLRETDQEKPLRYNDREAAAKIVTEQKGLDDAPAQPKKPAKKDNEELQPKAPKPKAKGKEGDDPFGPAGGPAGGDAPAAGDPPAAKAPADPGGAEPAGAAGGGVGPDPFAK